LFNHLAWNPKLQSKKIPWLTAILWQFLLQPRSKLCGFFCYFLFISCTSDLNFFARYPWGDYGWYLKCFSIFTTAVYILRTISHFYKSRRKKRKLYFFQTYENVPVKCVTVLRLIGLINRKKIKRVKMERIILNLSCCTPIWPHGGRNLTIYSDLKWVNYIFLWKFSKFNPLRKIMSKT